jgi:peptidoglycan hydrolase CwlO-like protein
MHLSIIISCLFLHIKTYPLPDSVQLSKREISPGHAILGVLGGATLIGGMIAVPAMRSQVMLMNEQMATVTNKLTTVLESSNSAIKSLNQQIEPLSQKFATNMDSLTNQGNAAMQSAKGLADESQNLVSYLRNSPASMANAAGNAVRNAPANMANAAGNAVNAAGNAVRNAPANLANAAGNAVARATGAITDGAKRLFDEGVGALSAGRHLTDLPM